MAYSCFCLEQIGPRCCRRDFESHHIFFISWRRFSTQGREWADPKNPLLMKDKAASALHMLYRRVHNDKMWSKDRVKYVREDRAKSFLVCSIILVVTNTYYTMTNLWALEREALAGSRK